MGMNKQFLHFFRKFLHVALIGMIFVPTVPIWGQIGGRHVYDFLNVPPSARLAAQGGTNVSLFDDDVIMAAENPALLNDSMHHHVGLSFQPYLAGNNGGYTGYARKIKEIGVAHAGVRFLSSGPMQGADAFGNQTGTFSANEAMVMLGYSDYFYQRFRYGVNLKFITSSLGPGFTSTGIAVDLGTSYHSKDKLFSAGLVVRNVGVQLSTYTGAGTRQNLPVQIVAGISNKLRYMPLRLSVTLIQLENPNLIVDDVNADPDLDFNGNPIEPGPRVADRIFRHFVFGGEFLFGKSLRLRGGYNHMRRQELRSANRGAFSGFSLGVGIRGYRFAFDYGFSSFGPGGPLSAHQLSLILNLNPRPVSQDS